MNFLLKVGCIGSIFFFRGFNDWYGITLTAGGIFCYGLLTWSESYYDGYAKGYNDAVDDATKVLTKLAEEAERNVSS